MNRKDDHMKPFRQMLAAALMLTWIVPAASSPEEDRNAFLALFEQRFPGVPLQEYIHGSMMLSEDARAQYESIMDFPPFQGDIDRGREIWERPFGNGKTFADCFENGGRLVASA